MAVVYHIVTTIRSIRNLVVQRSTNRRVPHTWPRSNKGALSAYRQNKVHLTASSKYIHVSSDIHIIIMHRTEGFVRGCHAQNADSVSKARLSYVTCCYHVTGRARS